MTLDPYSVLGLARGATAEQIRAAYRNLSKTAHPDGGGDAEAFARIKLAHEVLIDPVRRWKYDTTGSVDSTEADNTHVALMQLLGEWLDRALANVVGRGERAEDNDIVAEMKACVAQSRDMIAAKRSDLLASRPHWANLAARFDAKKGPNRLADIVMARVGSIDQNLQAMGDAEAKITTAAALLDDYVFRRDLILRARPSDMLRFWGKT